MCRRPGPDLYGCGPISRPFSISTPQTSIAVPDPSWYTIVFVHNFPPQISTALAYTVQKEGKTMQVDNGIGPRTLHGTRTLHGILNCFCGELQVS